MPAQVVCLGRGCLIPKGACEHAATKSGSPASREGSREGSAEAQPEPRACHGAPVAVVWGWREGMACATLGDSVCLGLAAYQLPVVAWLPSAPRVPAGFGVAAVHHHRGGEEHFLDRPPPCILGTHHEKGAQTFWSVVNRLPLSGNAVLCWKFCHVFHKLLRDGHSNVSAASLAQQLPWGQILSPAGLHGVVGDAGGLVPSWGSVLGGDWRRDPSLLTLLDPSRRWSARNPPALQTPVPTTASVLEETARPGSLVQEPSARILLPRVWMGKLRHPGAGGSDTTSRLQGREHIETSHSLPQLPAPSMARLAPVLCLLPVLPAYFHHHSSRS